MADQVDIAGDDQDAIEARDAIEKRAIAASRRRDQRATEDLQRVMSTVSGRRFVWGLLEDCHIHHGSFRHGEPVESAVFREGERNVGLKIMARINSTCPDLYAVMVREATTTEDNNDDRE